MTNKTFKVAGITVHDGNSKVRFTDDMIRRIKQFTKGGATRADFVELPSEMTKVEALNYLKNHPDFQSPADQATINDSLSEREKSSPKDGVKVKVPKSKSKPNLDNIKARAKQKKKQEESVEDADMVSE